MNEHNLPRQKPGEVVFMREFQRALFPGESPAARGSLHAAGRFQRPSVLFVSARPSNRAPSPSAL